MQRDRFLFSSAGLLSGLVLMSCSPGAGIVSAARMRDLASLMRDNGIARINYQGVASFADGHVEHDSGRAKQDVCPITANSHGRGALLLCDGQIDPNTGLRQIGHTSTSYSPGTLGSSLGPGYLNMVAATGPEFVFGTAQAVSPPKCAAELAGAAGMAWGMATYIQQNAWKYSSAISSSANMILKRYQGTTMGIAAAAEFIAAVIASLGAADTLLLLTGIGITAGAAWLVFACYDAAYDGPPYS